MPDGSLPVLFEGTHPLEVVIAPAPFEPRIERRRIEPGFTVAEILFSACVGGILNPQDLCRTEVDIDGGRILDREGIASLRPLPGQIVNVTVQVYGGGRGGGGKALQAVLQVAVMVAAFAVAGPAGSAAVGFTGATGAAATAVTALASAAASTAVLAAGGLLQNSLAGSSSSIAADTYSLLNQSNQKRLREQFPLCLGTRRWAFDLASSAYTTYSGDDMWITAIYALHYGPCTLSNSKIGETLFSAYPDGEIQTETFLVPGPRNSALYPTNIHQDNFSTTLDRVHGDIAVASTPDDSASLELDFIWAGGLYFPKADGRTVNADTAILIEVSAYGTDNWQPAPGLPAGTDKSGNHYAAGTYYVQAASKTPIRRTCTIQLPSTGRWDIRMRRNTRAVDATDNDAVTWTALRVPKPGKPILDENLSILVVKVKAAQDLSGSLGVVSGTVTPLVPKYVGGLWQGDPAAYDATHWAPSNNAAALTRYLLTGYPARNPMQPSEVDATCGEQHELIAANGWEAGVLLTGGTQQDAMLKLAAAGRMLIYWSGSQLVFVPDWAKDAPKQMFNARNAQGYRRKRTYPDEIHALWVEFTNVDEDYAADGIFVYADGYNASSATLLEKLTLDYACLPDRAHKEGRVFLAKRELQVWAHEFTAGADAVVSSYGDRVRARRTSGLYGQSDARVSFRRWSGSLIAGVRLDAAVKMVAGASYAIDVRRPDGLVLSVAIATTPGTVRDIVFATPLPVAQAPGKGDLISFGKVNQVTEDLEIIDITPQADGTVQIRAANYVGNEIEAAETGPIPDLATFLSTRVAAPTPRIISATGTSDGVTVSYEVDAQRTASLKGFVARWRVTPASGSASAWNTLPPLPPSQRTFTTPPISGAQHEAGDSAGEVRVDVQIWSVLTTGEPSSAASANGILVIQGVLPVVGFDADGVIRTGEDGSSYPALAVRADPVLSGSVQDLIVELQPASADPEAWTSAGQPLPAANPAGDFNVVAGGKIYDVRARWRTSDGWKGDWTTRTGVAIPAHGLVSSGVTAIAGRTPLQVVGDLDALAGLVTDLSTRTGDWYITIQQQLDASPTSSVVGTIQTALANMALDLTYLGAKSTDGTLTYWALSGATVIAAGGGEGATSFNELRSTLAGHGATITQISQILNGEDGFTLKYGIALDNDGHVTGIYLDNDGTVGAFRLVADALQFVDPNDGSPFNFLTYEDGVLAINATVRAKRLIVNGAVVPVRASASSSVAGDGSLVTILSTSLVLEEDGWVEVVAAANQSFGSTPLSWGFVLEINGANVWNPAGTAPGDSVPIIGAAFCPAGTVTVVLKWAGAVGLTCTSRTLFAKGMNNTA